MVHQQPNQQPLQGNSSASSGRLLENPSCAAVMRTFGLLNKVAERS